MERLTLKLKLTYKSSLLEDVFIGIAALLTGYFYYYENKKIIYNVENTESINHAIKITLGVIIIITWLLLSFQNGIKNRQSFVICTLCIWVIPQIVKYLVDTYAVITNEPSMQRSFALLAQYLSGINYLSLKTLGDALYDSIGIPYYLMMNIIIILFEVMFIAGFATGNKFFGTDTEIAPK